MREVVVNGLSPGQDGAPFAESAVVEDRVVAGGQYC